MIGVDVALKCGALEREAASDVGVKTPLTSRPRAWAVESQRTGFARP